MLCSGVASSQNNSRLHGLNVQSGVISMEKVMVQPDKLG